MTKIAFLFPRVGLSGADMGASWLLPKIVGLGHASELLFTGDFIGADRAAEHGPFLSRERAGANRQRAVSSAATRSLQEG